MTIRPLGMIEVAVKEAIEDIYPAALGKVGGDISYDGSTDFYVLINQFAGHSDLNGGEWFMDIDVFAKTYGIAMRTSLDISAALLDGAHQAPEMVIDRVIETTSPTDRPWPDEQIFRIGGTYSVSARRRD